MNLFAFVRLTFILLKNFFGQVTAQPYQVRAQTIKKLPPRPDRSWNRTQETSTEIFLESYRLTLNRYEAGFNASNSWILLVCVSKQVRC